MCVQQRTQTLRHSIAGLYPDCTHHRCKGLGLPQQFCRKPQTPHVDQIRWTLRSLQPIQLMRRPAMDVSGVPWTLALACATYGPQRWWRSTAPKVHQECQELRSCWFPQNVNSSIVCGLSFPSISHLQTVALLDIASWHSDVQSRQFQLDKAGIHSDLMD